MHPTSAAAPGRRPTALCRSWLFLAGADEATLAAAARCGADVLIQDLEDFTPPPLRPRGRQIARDVFAAWRAAGRVVAVRVNALDSPDGQADIAAAMAARPDIVLLPKVASPGQIAALDAAMSAAEAQHGLPLGSTEIVANLETAEGLVRLGAIAGASRRIAACLLASEDLVADLGLERTREGEELAYARRRFQLECVAAGVLAIDAPYTYSDAEGAAADARRARTFGFRAKSLVRPEHAPEVNSALTPAPAAVAQARRLIAAFEGARAAGQDRAALDGHLVEVPSYRAAQRLIERAEALGRWDGA